MEVEVAAPAAEDADARLRRVLAATPGVAFRLGKKKGGKGGTPVHPDHATLRRRKKALKRGAAL